MFKAEVIKDSVSLEGARLTTMECTYPRFVHSEMMTHRVFSRNAASSRAIPVSKQIQAVIDNPAMPIEFGKNQSGMQAKEVVEDQDAARELWLESRDRAVEQAIKMNDMGIHKQIVNRILEPYVWMTVIISSTQWDNFFKQRCSELAQPEIHAIADMMRAVRKKSHPDLLRPGQWHTPYIQPDEDFDTKTAKAVSAARCARVSYMTHDGVRDFSKDLELYGFLIAADPGHWSPLEHVARPLLPATTGFTGLPSWSHQAALGNFRGWGQLRHDVE